MLLQFLNHFYDFKVSLPYALLIVSQYFALVNEPSHPPNRSFVIPAKLSLKRPQLDSNLAKFLSYLWNKVIELEHIVGKVRG